MILLLQFSCQARSSIAIMNSQVELVYFQSTPSQTLNDEEVVSCKAQTNKTAIITVIIGGNTFRSNFMVYDAFVDQDVTLYPDKGSSVIAAQSFSVAKYEITFLENELIQTAAIGQLFQAFFNYNECFPTYDIKYQTNNFIQPFISTNPKCQIAVDMDMNYLLILNNDIILNENITVSEFNFSTLELAKKLCSAGTPEQQEMCKQNSNIISGDNFVSLQLILTFPQKITTENIYNDSYGVEQTDPFSSNVDLIFVFLITTRESADSCTTYNALGFLPSSLFVKQIMTPTCVTEPFTTHEKWVFISEFPDNSGRNFQLQFYNENLFDVEAYADCTSWEISNYVSQHQCLDRIDQIQEYKNPTAEIVYKFYVDGVFDGANRFNAISLQTGTAEITLSSATLCVELDESVVISSDFATMEIDLSADIRAISNHNVFFQTQGYFKFPSVGNTYCFVINPQEAAKIDEYSRVDIYGIVLLENYILYISSLKTYIPYEEFWEGWVVLVVGLTIISIFAIIKFKIENKKMK